MSKPCCLVDGNLSLEDPEKAWVEGLTQKSLQLQLTTLQLWLKRLRAALVDDELLFSVDSTTCLDGRLRCPGCMCELRKVNTKS